MQNMLLFPMVKTHKVKNKKTFSYKSLLSTLSSMFKILPKNYKWQILLLFFLQISSSLLEVVGLSAIIPFLNALANFDSFVANPYVSRILIELEVQEKVHVIILTSCIFAITICCSNFLKIVVMWYQRHLGATMDVNLGVMVYQKMLNKPYRFFLDNNSSELIGNLTHDLRATFSALTSLLAIVTCSLMSVSIVTGLLFYDPGSALTLLGASLVSYILISLGIRQKLHHSGTVESKSYQSMLKNRSRELWWHPLYYS